MKEWRVALVDDDTFVEESVQDGPYRPIAALLPNTDLVTAACLITAAPELLEALRGLLSITVDPTLTAPEQREEVRAASQAIERAEADSIVATIKVTVKREE